MNPPMIGPMTGPMKTEAAKTDTERAHFSQFGENKDRSDALAGPRMTGFVRSAMTPPELVCGALFRQSAALMETTAR